MRQGACPGDWPLSFTPQAGNRHSHFRSKQTRKDNRVAAKAVFGPDCPPPPGNASANREGISGYVAHTNSWLLYCDGSQTQSSTGWLDNWCSNRYLSPQYKEQQLAPACSVSWCFGGRSLAQGVPISDRGPHRLPHRWRPLELDSHAVPRGPALAPALLVLIINQLGGNQESVAL